MVYKQSRLKGRILANSVGRRKPAVNVVYGARKGLVPLESDAIRPELSLGNVSTCIGPSDRARNDAARLRISGRYYSDRSDAAGTHAQLNGGVPETTSGEPESK